MAVETEILRNIVRTIEATTPPTKRLGGYKVDTQQMQLEATGTTTLGQRRFVARCDNVRTMVGSQGQETEALDYQVTHTVELGYTLPDFTPEGQGIVAEDARAITRALTSVTNYDPTTTGIYHRTVSASVQYDNATRQALVAFTITTEYRAQ